MLFVAVHEKLLLPDNLAQTIQEAKRVTAPGQVIWGEEDEVHKHKVSEINKNSSVLLLVS